MIGQITAHYQRQHTREARSRLQMHRPSCISQYEKVGEDFMINWSDQYQSMPYPSSNPICKLHIFRWWEETSIRLLPRRRLLLLLSIGDLLLLLLQPSSRLHLPLLAIVDQESQRPCQSNND